MLSKANVSILISILSLLIAGAVAISDWLRAAESLSIRPIGVPQIRYAERYAMKLSQEIVVANHSTRTSTVTRAFCEIGYPSAFDGIRLSSCRLDEGISFPMTISPGEVATFALHAEFRSFDDEINQLMARFFEALPDEHPTTFFSYLQKNYGRDFFGNQSSENARNVSGADPILFDENGRPITTGGSGYALLSGVIGDRNDANTQTVSVGLTTTRKNDFESEQFWPYFSGSPGF